VQTLRFDEILLEVNEHYQKQSLRNRCYILSANGILPLSVPVKGGASRPWSEIEIDNGQRWKDIHWRSIYSAYGKSPFFDFFGDEIHALIQNAGSSLLELNQAVLTKCLELLRIKTRVGPTKIWRERYDNHIVDLRGLIQPIQPIPPPLFYRHIGYRQVFGKDFVPNLSVIDLIFCTGPEARQILSQSIHGDLNI
jgi:hypothetical protein